MATLELPSRPTSPAMLPRKWARKCERYCCLGATYFPLLFVYGITTWAVMVEASIGFQPSKSSWIGTTSSFIGIALYVLLNWSYTSAVFTNPGSTIEITDGYSSLPMHAPPVATHFTVKSTGELRFCKKCQARKPDRAHHCSTCKRCVLKMDHHCPWLATCVGLHNYKYFLLFLIYTTLFCMICFAVSGSWVWSEILSDGQYNDTIAPVNNIMLAVIAGIIGIVLFGFTGWHILLALRGQTTIECLEKTRYLSPLRKAMQHQHIVQHQDNDNPSFGQQLADIHTNALPGVTRPEEGEATLDGIESPNPRFQQSYEARERNQARDRYEEYLDEQDSAKLPSAFDLGWRQNLRDLFGKRPLLWFFPVNTTIGDGWRWEASPKWLAARERIREEREAQRERERAAGWGGDHLAPPAYQAVNASGAGRHWLASPAPSKADRVLGRHPSQYTDTNPTRTENTMSMHTIRRHDEDLDEDDYDESSDEEAARERETDRKTGSAQGQQWRKASSVLGRPAKAKATSGISRNPWGDVVDEGVD